MKDDQKDAASQENGLDYLKAHLDNWQGSAMADTMNIRLIDVADGRATFEGNP